MRPGGWFGRLADELATLQPTIKFKNSRTLIGFSKNNNKVLGCVQHYTTAVCQQGLIPAPVFFFFWRWLLSSKRHHYRRIFLKIAGRNIRKRKKIEIIKNLVFTLNLSRVILYLIFQIEGIYAFMRINNYLSVIKLNGFCVSFMSWNHRRKSGV